MSTISSGTTSTTTLIHSGDTTGSLVFKTNDTGSGGTTAMTIDTSQNVGVGVTSPSYKLDIQNGTARIYNSTYPSLRIHNSATGTASNDGLLLEMGGLDANIVNYEVGNMIFKTNNTEAMRIDSSGNLLVGTTSNYGTSRAMISSANSGTYPSLTVENTASSAPWVYNSRLPNNGGNASNTYHFVGTTSTGDKVYIWGNGNIVNTNNSYGAISDIKLKENIVDATPKLEDLCKIKVRQYNLKSEPSLKQIGVVAQELETIFPAMVEESFDRDEEGKLLETTTKSVKYSVFVPILVKAVQELKAINDQQAQTITAQSEAIASLSEAMASLTARLSVLENK